MITTYNSIAYNVTWLSTCTVAHKYKIKRKMYVCTHDTIIYKLHYTHNVIAYRSIAHQQ